jgi:hypothetical protein
MLLSRTRRLGVAAARRGGPHPPSGFPAFSRCSSSTDLTRGVIGITVRAAAVLPCIPRGAPFRPCSHVTFSHRSRKHSSWRAPVSDSTAAIDASGSGAAARYRASSSKVITGSQRRSPESTFTFGAMVSTPHSVARFKMRRRTRSELFAVLTCVPRRKRCAAN